MSARPFKFTTLNTNNLRKVSDQGAVFKGAVLLNTTTNEYFVKLYWHRPTAAVPEPVVGTTVPQLTLPCPPFVEAVFGLPGLAEYSFDFGVVANDGQLWVAVTGVAADGDNTAVAAGQGIITLMVE